MVDVTVREQLPGVHGYADLRRDRRTVELGERQTIYVASPLDLLRIEDARGRPVLTALQALLDYQRRWPNGPPERRSYTDQQAHQAIEAWLNRHRTPTAKH